MSEKEDWKKVITEIVQDETKPLNKKMENLYKLLQPPPSSETKEHPVHSIKELLDCPDCYPKVKSAVINKEFKDAKYECEECGLPVKGEESKKDDWKCPGCEHKYARPKD